MATQEKLLRSLESLNQILNSNLTLEPSRNKEKTVLSIVITETLTNPSIQVAPNFTNLLSCSIEVLLKICGDLESDVSLVGEECLNRVIKATLDGNALNASKIHFELFKKINENGDAKCLRAALWRFSELAHLIKPVKGKIYISKFLQVICKITERPEELIHETLGNSIPKLMKALGNFMSDSETKTLLKGFLVNVQNPSAVVRRVAAQCIVSICLNCKNKSYFLIYVFNSLIGVLIPTDESLDSAVVIGVLGSLKTILPHIGYLRRDVELKGYSGSSRNNSEITIEFEKYLQVYEVCLYFLSNLDHNIINASLETLSILLQNCPIEVEEALINPNGLGKSFLMFRSNSQLKFKSPSCLSVTTTSQSIDDIVNSESELLDSMRPDIEKWIDESKLSVLNVTYANTSTKSPSKVTPVDLVDYEFANFEKDSECASSITETESSEFVKPDYITYSMDKLVLSEKSSEKSCSFQDNKSVDTYLSSQDIYIGCFEDSDCSLLYCIRLLCKSFLLTGKKGNLISDRNVRVSVKSLTFSCLSSITKLYPEGFLLSLQKNPLGNDDYSGDNQRISNILLYSDHSDPQLRGNVRIFVSNFIESVIVQSGNEYSNWIYRKESSVNSVFSIENLINIIVKGLEDESSTCSRQTLIGLKTVLQILLQSNDNQCCSPSLHVLPILASNPYWLVKTKLIEILSDICYTTINFVTGNNNFQEKILHSVFFEMLKVDDSRVRTTCSKAIVRLIPQLYFPQDDCNMTAAIHKAKQFKKEQLNEDYFDDNNASHLKNRFIRDLIFPFNKICSVNVDNNVEQSLSRVIMKLKETMLTSKSKYFVYGCIETLFELSLSYPTTTYVLAWSCFKVRESSKVINNGFNFYNYCVNLLTTNTIIYDINCHINLLHLVGNIFAGIALTNLKPKLEIDFASNVLPWDMFEDRNLASTTDLLLCHVMRLLNIFVHVIEGVIPTIPQNKTVLGNLPPSPMKKRKSDPMEKVKSLSPMKSSEKDDKSNSKSYFASSPHYIKIYEILKTAYTNYKITLDFQNPGKFVELLQSVLEITCQIFEIGNSQESGPVVEEILSFLNFIFVLAPSNTVECVQQLLKSVFKANITNTNLENYKEEFNETENSFYYNIFQKPYDAMSSLLKKIRQSEKVRKSDDNVMGYLHRKVSIISRGSEKKSFNQFRFFEVMFIKSLKQYIITSDVLLQCKVLKLLCQLVQLKVNYCVLDSDQKFIGFVLKQFENIEEGLVNFPEQIIPRIFDFLVHLSDGKQHSKSVIDIPKIIQLCDGLMASGQPPLQYCIAALKPVIEDIFLIRNKSNITDFKELETTREVLFAMLHRLLEYSEVIDLLVIILNESKHCNDNGEKWLRWSKQVVENLLPALKKNKIRLNRKGTLTSMKQLILALNCQSFKPLQNILAVLFENPPQNENKLSYINNWLGKIITLLIMSSYFKEEVFLMEIVEIQEEFSPQSVFHKAVVTSDPLNVTNSTEFFSGVPPEVIFTKFIFRVIEIISTKCIEAAKIDKENYLINQFSDFLIFCLHIFQSGSHCKITRTAVQLLTVNEVPKSDEEQIQIEEINSNFLYLSSFFPNLTLYWCYLLTLLNYNNRKFWANILQVTDSYGILEQLKSSNPQDYKCIMSAIVKTGGIIFFCDYLNENVLDREQLSWFLINSIESLVSLSHEIPVFEFFTSLNRDASASGLVVQSIAAKCLNKREPSFNVKVLKCIENAHYSQTGLVLKIFLPKMLDSKHLAISRMVATVASRKVELLLTLPVEDVNSQLPREDFNEIMVLLVKTKLARKHETLVALLNKLAISFYDLSPIEFEQRRTVNPEYIKNLEIDKNWFVAQIKQNSLNPNLSNEMSHLLLHLDNESLIGLLAKKDFNLIILKDCIKVCANKIKEENLKEEPILLKHVVAKVLENVRHITSFTPKPHQVYKVLDRESSPSEKKYNNKLSEIFSDEIIWSFLHDTILCVTCFIEFLPSLPFTKIPDSYYEDLMKFAVICLESINFLLDVDKCNLIKYIVDSLKCAELIAKEIYLCGILGLDTHISWLCSAVNSIYKIASKLLSEKNFLPIVPKYCLKNTLENIETVAAGHCCYQLSVLIVWLENGSENVDVPKYLFEPIKSLIVSFARLPLVNSYILTPPSAWKSGFSVELSGIFTTLVPPLPIEFLREVDILEEFIFRISLLGWVNRQQFEETWMCLLSVLNSTSNESFNSENSDARSTSIAVSAITSLLLQTMHSPLIGNPNISTILHVPRHKIFDTSLESIYRLKLVQNKFINQFKEYAKSHNITTELFNVFTMPNLEKSNSRYSYGQLSIEYLMVTSKVAATSSKNHHITKVYNDRKKVLEDSGLDLTSCLQFLIDLYSQWLISEVTPVRLLHEVLKSVVVLSDLFTDESQYRWMLDSFISISKSHIPEDEIIHQYLVTGCCKAASILTTDLEICELVKKLIVQNLTSNFISCRIAALHGILYILQGCILRNNISDSISEETQLFLPIATEYVQVHTNIKNDVLSQSLDHMLLTWSLAFYVIENIDENHLDSQLVSTVLQATYSVFQLKTWTRLQIAVLKGLERLIIRKCLGDKSIEQIMKIAVENIKTKSSPVSLAALQLLLSCTYINSLKKKNNEYEDNPDNLFHLLEKISIIFDYIKKGVSSEVKILCNILPEVLNYFFTPADILTKVLGEFLSQQQTHPKLLSSVVFAVFENAIKQSQLSLLQDWVVLSLSNFTNSFSMAMATWYLTCFFVSASTNQWLRSLFPYIQARIGRFEYEDRKMLCIAGADFYKNLNNEKQKQIFIESFTKVKDQIDSPFNDLLASVL